MISVTQNVCKIIGNKIGMDHSRQNLIVPSAKSAQVQKENRPTYRMTSLYLQDVTIASRHNTSILRLEVRGLDASDLSAVTRVTPRHAKLFG